MMRIGVFCYQGGHKLHLNALKNLGFKAEGVSHLNCLDDFDGLILPGGESSAQYNYCKEYKLLEKIIDFSKTGKPILGTCAGAILLSKYKDERVKGMGLIDINISRNFYGTQIHSGIKMTDDNQEAFFIRAPKISEIGKAVETLQTFKSDPIFVRQGNVFCTSTHPELCKLGKNNIIYKVFSNHY